jgi:hypothetical protein
MHCVFRSDSESPGALLVKQIKQKAIKSMITLATHELDAANQLFEARWTQAEVS